MDNAEDLDIVMPDENYYRDEINDDANDNVNNRMNKKNNSK